MTFWMVLMISKLDKCVLKLPKDDG